MQCVLVGAHAVRLNGFVRSAEDIEILLPSSIDNGRKVIRALNFLPSSAELGPTWFDVDPAAPEIIRVADALPVDLLFAANDQTFESLQPHVRKIEVEVVPIATLEIEGLLKTNTDYREKDLIDKSVLTKLKNAMK